MWLSWPEGNQALWLQRLNFGCCSAIHMYSKDPIDSVQFLITRILLMSFNFFQVDIRIELAMKDTVLIWCFISV